MCNPMPQNKSGESQLERRIMKSRAENLLFPIDLALFSTSNVNF